MAKLLLLVLYAVYCIAIWIFAKQEIRLGQADVRYLLVALGSVPLWGIPLFLKTYRRLSRKRQR